MGVIPDKKTGKGKYRKLEQVPDVEEEKKPKSKGRIEEDDEEAQPKITKKKKNKKLNLNALPEEPVELTCPLCGYEGETVLKKSF